jgi:hypothetical protein
MKESKIMAKGTKRESKEEKNEDREKGKEEKLMTENVIPCSKKRPQHVFLVVVSTEIGL